MKKVDKTIKTIRIPKLTCLTNCVTMFRIPFPLLFRIITKMFFINDDDSKRTRN